MIIRRFFFFFSSRRRHTRLTCDWSSDVCSSDLGAGDVLRRETALLGRALETKALEVQRREIGDYPVNALQHEGAARPTHDRAVERQMSAGMLQHREAEAKTSRALLLVRQHGPQVLEPADQERLLIGEMGIECRPADVRSVDDVLD